MRSKYSDTNRVIKNNLSRKYNYDVVEYSINSRSTERVNPKTQCSIVYKNIIDCIVRPKNYLNAYRVNYQQTQILSNIKQYLKRYYGYDQYKTKCQALTQYYKYHRNYPIHSQININIMLILLSNQQMRNKFQRKLIKKIMNQPSSVSGSEHLNEYSNSYSVTKKLRPNKQLTLNIRQLCLSNNQPNSNMSSILLESICQKINNAFKFVKPHYIFKGIYNDGVKQFKTYMRTQRNQKFSNKNKDPLNVNNLQYMNQDKTNHEEIDQIISQNTQKNDQEHKLQASKESDLKNKKDSLYFKNKVRFQNTKVFRKTMTANLNTNFQSHSNTHNIRNLLAHGQNPSLILKSNKRQNTIKMKRNKTVTTSIKPQSFSKNVQNQTLSKQQNLNIQMVGKRRVKSSIRIRNCKSISNNIVITNENNTHRLNITKKRSNTKLTKFHDTNKQKKNIENFNQNLNQQKMNFNSNKDNGKERNNPNMDSLKQKILKKAKSKGRLKLGTDPQKNNKQPLKFNQIQKSQQNMQSHRHIQRIQTGRTFCRQQSKPNLRNFFGSKQKQKKTKLQSANNNQNALNNLVKNKLKLRA